MAGYQTSAMRHAQNAGIDHDLFARLINQESGWNPNAKSPVDAYGLTQVMPATARDPGFGVAPMAPGWKEDPEEQMRFGSQYLGKMLDRYDGDVNKALAAYNWGAGNADDWDGDLASLPEETRGYISNITNKDRSSMANMVNNSSASPNGTGGEAVMAGLTTQEDEDEEEEEKKANYGDQVSSGLRAMETGDLSDIKWAKGGAGLMDDARANWGTNKENLAGLGSGLSGFFGGPG